MISADYGGSFEAHYSLYNRYYFNRWSSFAINTMILLSHTSSHKINCPACRVFYCGILTPDICIKNSPCNLAIKGYFLSGPGYVYFLTKLGTALS
ncbi:hypothetical protein ACVLD2_000611 [Paenibacillus sp. PvR052]|nr:hypothetical protein [Paenibacillus sp. PvP091]MBP1169139.1 hypothetical protein [Paenibacillus sp. PvR098]MBP2440167.1 hypothetical protein [Paenibacillus sp. PvP052]